MLEPEELAAWLRLVEARGIGRELARELLARHGSAEAVVGAPKAALRASLTASQGEENARSFAAAISRAGLTVVSGLALGIDGKAHQGALEGPGSTIAIVGTGLDRVYPKRHLALAHRIAREGLIVSDFPVGMPAL